MSVPLYVELPGEGHLANQTNKHQYIIQSKLPDQSSHYETNNHGCPTKHHHQNRDHIKDEAVPRWPNGSSHNVWLGFQQQQR